MRKKTEVMAKITSAVRGTSRAAAYVTGVGTGTQDSGTE